MFSGWQAFYQVTGSAAGALIGLLFIVATLSAGRRTAASISGGQLFTGPTVFHLALVLMISALALMPLAEGGVSTVILCACVLAGFGYSVKIAIGLSRLTNPTHWTDLWFYGVAPVAAYVGLAASAVAGLCGLAHAACAAAVMLLVLLMLAIRNAWDLVTWLAARAHPVGAAPPPQEPS
jgi:hypothetical protein